MLDDVAVMGVALNDVEVMAWRLMMWKPCGGVRKCGSDRLAFDDVAVMW